MSRLRRFTAGGDEYREFACPGCTSTGQRETHAIPVSGAKAWGFNGSDDAPTFTPSILVRWVAYDHEAKTPEAMAATRRDVVCHSFVTDGRIQFLSDCTHQLAGQTVDLPEAAPDTERP